MDVGATPSEVEVEATKVHVGAHISEDGVCNMEVEASPPFVEVATEPVNAQTIEGEQEIKPVCSRARI